MAQALFLKWAAGPTIALPHTTCPRGRWQPGGQVLSWSVVASAFWKNGGRGFPRPAQASVWLLFSLPASPSLFPGLRIQGPRKAFLFPTWHLAKPFVATGFPALNTVVWKAPLLWSSLDFYVFWAVALIPQVLGAGSCLPAHGFPRLVASCPSSITPTSFPGSVYLEARGDRG